MRILCSCFMLLVVGCNNAPPRVVPDQPDPKAGEQALQLHDTDRDGALNTAELEKAPGLKAAINLVDADLDGKITAAEISARLQAWQKSRMGRMSISCLMKRGGQPLPGVEVRLVPEKFLGGALKTATGTTNEQGIAMLSLPVEGDGVGGVCPGFYRVEVHSSASPLPPKYHSETILGLEVAADAQALLMGAAPFNLD